MGAVFAKLAVANPLEPARETTVKLLVDTGALYSVVPTDLLTGLGIERLDRKAFKTADGRRIERAVGEAVFIYNGERGTSKVIFGVEGDATVLGVTALEEMGLEVDPTTGTIRPATLFLYFAGKGKGAFQVACPHCEAKLTVDAELGEVLEHVPPPKKSDYDFDQQLKGLSEADRKREELFRQQVAAQKDRAKLLERKFEESFEKRKDEPVEKPLRDFDLE